MFAELVWTPAQLIQAEDRAHRLGQSGSLEVLDAFVSVSKCGNFEAEMEWTPAQLIQAEDRAHRLGQAGSLEVQCPYCKNICEHTCRTKGKQLIQAEDQAHRLGQSSSIEVAALSSLHLCL